MSQEMEKQLGGTSEEDYEDEVEEIEMEVKEEDGEGGSGGGFFSQEAAIGEHIQIQSVGIGGRSGGHLQIRRCRPKEEKERTKLRERHRRAITARILAGLRRHGNYNLRVRADINDVISALAREAGWIVLPDGTTFPSKSTDSPNAQAIGQTEATPISTIPSTTPTQTPPLRAISSSPSALNLQNCRLKTVYTPPLSTNDKQVMDAHARMPEQDYAGTPYVPVYVMMPLGLINDKCEVVDPEGVMRDLKSLKDINVDGVTIDCWWGIVEANEPLEYNWNGYKRLFQIVRELKLKLQVVMSFHECGGNIGDDVHIPLPHWVAEIGKTNPDIFFTDQDGRRNYECLTWGIDKERVLRGRNAVEVYFDYMRCFRTTFHEFFEDGIISEVRVGLGSCGELRYPSYPVKHGWRYPGIGQFQSYDQYLMKSLRKAAEARGHPTWARAPFNAGSYNSQPGDTGFFCDAGEYDNTYGRFFLGWYSKVLVDHADCVLYLAKLAFEGTSIAAKIPGVYWWYRTASHAAELTAGFYNPCNRDGYASIASTFQKHGAKLSLACAELHTLNQQREFPEALADPEGLIWQVLNAAWDVSVPVACENALPCYGRDCYNKILENAKPMNDPDGRHLSSFAYLRLSQVLMERRNFIEFERFVKRMHGEAVHDLL